MTDRAWGDTDRGEDAAAVMIVPGVRAEALRRLILPGYLILIAAFLWLSAPVAAFMPPSVGPPMVWLALSVALMRLAWVANRRATNPIEGRFWASMGAAAAFLTLSQGTYAIEILQSGPGGPPLASVSTVFDGLTVLVMAGLLASFARFRQSTWAARARFVVDLIAACVVVVGALDDWLVGPAFSVQVAGGLAGVLYSTFPVVGALVLLGTLWVVIGTHHERWQSWERWIGAAAGSFALALLFTPMAYSPHVTGDTAGWAPVVLDAVLLSALYFGLSAVVQRLADHAVPWRLRPVATIEPSYGWVAAVLLPSIELVAIPAFGVMAFQTTDPSERLLRLGIVALISLALALRTLLAVADSETLLARAETDPLTGLLNRRLFQDRLSDEVARASRQGGSVGLVAIDVDDFGATNSAGGHLAGDRALVDLCAAIGAAVRAQDVICRVGGDEITVILPGADLGAAFVTARRILDGIRAVTDSTGRHLTASAGVAACPENATDRDPLVAAADAALYWAKRHGKDRAVLFDEQVVEPVSAEQRIADLKERTNLDAVRALAAAVDARDPGTRSHSRNVSALSADLGRQIGADEDEITLLGFAGLLHDVGKIGLPDSVLRKRGVLTEKERSRLRDHAPLGAQILASTPMPEMLPWVRHHHERWDGAGHPDGLSGEMIPLGARVIAVCEAYDSLVSGRMGRTPQTPRAALQQIDLDLGAKFDPAVGEQFIRMVAARLETVADDGEAS